MNFKSIYNISGGNSLTSKALSGTIWSFLDSFSRQFISFLLGLVLARLLFPSDYGLIGMLQFFLAICQSITDCGFSNALICKKDRNDRDFSTAFYFNSAIGVLGYLILFLIAPLVSNFYNEPQLRPLLRVVGISVLFNSLSIVQNAILISTLQMRKLMRAGVITQTIAGIAGIICAYCGMGVWALAVQSVGSSILTCSLLWAVTGWKPNAAFSRDSFDYLWRFGSKMLLVGIVSTAYSNIHSLVIGKSFSKDDLGLYAKANGLARLAPNTLYSVLNKVSMPSFTQISNDKERLKEAFRKCYRVASFIIFPIMGYLFVFGKPLVLFLWTEKWLGAVSVFQIICLGCIWNTLDLLSISLLQIFHKPDILLRYEIINKFVGLAILIVTIQWGFMAVVIGRAVYNFYEFLVYSTTNSKYLGYSFSEQLHDFFPNLLLMLISMSVALLSTTPFSSNLSRLVLGFFVGSGLYLFLSWIFKMRSFRDLFSILVK